MISGCGAGGGMGIRTPDIQLAKLALYQLSYTPLSQGGAVVCFGKKKIKLYTAFLLQNLRRIII